MASREEWIGRTGLEWARRAKALDLLLGPPGDEGIAELAPATGEHILDLGCGSGASTTSLARAVGSAGAVLGLDVSPDLVTQARDAIADFPQARIVEADAQTYEPGEPPFDALYSRFGAMFFDDPPAAFRHLRGLLIPGARAVLVAWREPRLNQWAAVPMAAVPTGPAGGGGQSGPGPFAWADPSVFVPLLEDSGFTDVSHRAFDFQAEISEGDDPDPTRRAVDFMLRIGPLAAKLRGASDDSRREVGDFLARRLSRYVRDGAVRMPASAWIISARA